MRLYCASCDDTFPDYVVRDVFNPECPACGEPCTEFREPVVEFAVNRQEFTPAVAVPAAPTYQPGALFLKQAG